MGAEAGTPGLLVIDLVLEVDDVDTERRRSGAVQGSPGEPGKAVVARRHVLGPADGIAGGRALGVLTPAMTSGGPRLDLGRPGLQCLEVSPVEDRPPDR